MARMNKKGRSSSNQFICLHRGITNSDAWKALNCETKCLILLVWERHNGKNNGTIPLSHREARAALRIGNDKTTKAFHQAQERGFLIERIKGSFEWKMGAGQGRSTEWELTTEPCDGRPAKGDYRKWKNQNAVPNAGTAGSYPGNRSGKNTAPNGPNGSDSGNRFSHFRVVSGS